MVPSGSVTPLAVSDVVAADEVVDCGRGETVVAVSRTSIEVHASEVAIATSAEVVGMVTEATEVMLTAATPVEVAMRAIELALLLTLHAHFLDEIIVELEK